MTNEKPLNLSHLTKRDFLKLTGSFIFALLPEKKKPKIKPTPSPQPDVVSGTNDNPDTDTAVNFKNLAEVGTCLIIPTIALVLWRRLTSSKSYKNSLPTIYNPGKLAATSGQISPDFCESSSPAVGSPTDAEIISGWRNVQVQGEVFMSNGSLTSLHSDYAPVYFNGEVIGFAPGSLVEYYTSIAELLPPAHPIDYEAPARNTLRNWHQENVANAARLKHRS